MPDSKINFKTSVGSPIILGIAMIMIPLLLGIGYVMLYTAATARQAKNSRPALPPLPANYLAQLTSAPLSELTNLYHLARLNGIATDPINLSIWAAMADTPARVLSIEPPDTEGNWGWRCSVDGRYALAVGKRTDAAGRRNMALCDMVTGEWLWRSLLPWPEKFDDPYVFGLCTIVNFEKNGRRMALEINPNGKITALDYLSGKPHAATPAPQPPRLKDIRGTAVATRNGVLMVADSESGALQGYAINTLPGLYALAPAAETTTISGNGRLRFDIAEGKVRVYDILTHTLMQEVAVWRHTTNTTVYSTLVSNDGANLSLFFRTSFGDQQGAVNRDWSASLSTYAGKVTTSYDATAAMRPAKPVRSMELTSYDNRWHFNLSPAGTLKISTATNSTLIASVQLVEFCGTEPFTELTMLEGGRHLLLRQSQKLWLLDFASAQGYADLQARLVATHNRKNEPVAIDSDELADPTIDPLYEYSDAMWLETLSSLDIPSPAPVALRAELMIAHQVWPFAAWLLDQGATYSAMDVRAPRINPLLRARAHIMANQLMQQRATQEQEPSLMRAAALNRQSARDISKATLVTMLNSYTPHSRMERYQLQGFLFAAE